MRRLMIAKRLAMTDRYVGAKRQQNDSNYNRFRPLRANNQSNGAIRDKQMSSHRSFFFMVVGLV